jgi:hypothetical protein
MIFRKRPEAGRPDHLMRDLENPAPLLRMEKNEQ